MGRKAREIHTGNGETGDSLGIFVREANTLGVGAQNLDVGHLQVNPVLAVEDLGTVLGLSHGRAAVAVHTSGETGKADTNVDGGQVGLLGRRGRSGLGSGLRRVLAEALEKGRISSYSLERKQWTHLLQGLCATECLTSEHDCNGKGEEVESERREELGLCKSGQLPTRFRMTQYYESSPFRAGLCTRKYGVNWQGHVPARP